MVENLNKIHYKIMAEGIKDAFYEGINQFDHWYDGQDNEMWNNSVAKYEHDRLMEAYHVG